MFITFEGPDGSGKSSQVSMLSSFLRSLGYEVVETREPGGTNIGDQIRACLHDVENSAMTSITEVLLYSASRAQLVETVIRPALAQNKVVLCDRYADSTIAYQGYGRGLNLEDLAQLTRIATGGLLPDVTLLLDIAVERGLTRRERGGEEMNRLDLETIAFHQRVRKGFQTLAAADQKRWCTIDADQPVDAVQSDIREVVTSRLATSIPTE